MKKKILNLLLISILTFTIAGCNKETQKIPQESNSESEKFFYGVTLDDGRYVSFALEIPYTKSKDNDLLHALLYDEITIDTFLNKLEYVDALLDGGSKIYKYDKTKKIFGREEFYVISCNSLDNIKDIFIAKNRSSIEDKCSLKINDLDNVSMKIKEGTLTNTGATLVITDTSNKDNIYGDAYALEKEEDGSWVALTPKNNMVFNSIGYKVNKNNTLELNVNWDYHYGKLEKGKYRILKDTSWAGEGITHYITTEFTIE